LKNEGFKIGNFWVEDFFNFYPEESFDVVCSFGFIEHFYNFEDVIARHAALVKEGGCLMITTPNFRGAIQNFLHRHYDKGNLVLHNLKSMAPDKWAIVLENLGFEIIYKGHFGGFWFWTGNETLGPFKKRMLWIIQRLIPPLRKALWFESKSFSAYCGIVAKRK
jgi:SAM-dependent methyltransferase